MILRKMKQLSKSYFRRIFSKNEKKKRNVHIHTHNWSLIGSNSEKLDELEKEELFSFNFVFNIFS